MGDLQNALFSSLKKSQAITEFSSRQSCSQPIALMSMHVTLCYTPFKREKCGEIQRRDVDNTLYEILTEWLVKFLLEGWFSVFGVLIVGIQTETLILNLFHKVCAIGIKIQVIRKLRIPSAKVMWRLLPLNTAFEHCYKAGSVVLNYFSYFTAYIKHLLEDTDFFQKSRF